MLVQHTGHDLGIGTAAAQQAGSLTALGGGDDGGRADVLGGGAGGVSNGGTHRQAAVVRGKVMHQLVKAGIRLGGLGDGGHGLEGRHRVLACGGLAGEHHRAGAVVDGVGHVGDFGTSGAGVGHHGIQHLGGGDADLAGAHGPVNEVFLQRGNFRKIDLHAKVAAGHHDAVRHGQNFIDVVDALLVLDLGDDAHAGVVLVQQMADLHNVLRAAGKAGGHQIVALLDAEQDVLPVALAHIGHGQMYAGHIDALLGLDDAVIFHGADDVSVGDFINVQSDEAVVQHDAAARPHIVGQVFIGDGADLVGALDLAAGQRELLARHQLFHAVGEGAQTDLRAFGVQHGGHGHTQFLRQSAQLVQTTLVLGVIAVREIESGHVHAVFQQLAQHAFLVGGRAKGANDLGLAHRKHPPVLIQ